MLYNSDLQHGLEFRNYLQFIDMKVHRKFLLNVIKIHIDNHSDLSALPAGCYMKIVGHINYAWNINLNVRNTRRTHP